jgi:hypothetical protein
MTNITLSIPEDIKKEMEKFPEINWSEIARASIIKRISFLKEMNKLLKDSEMTEEDAITLGRKVNKAIAKKLNLK